MKYLNVWSMLVYYKNVIFIRIQKKIKIQNTKIYLLESYYEKPYIPDYFLHFMWFVFAC